jgi:V/A-type H+-transporting ATPase subunit K
MTIITLLLTLSVLALIAGGFYLELQPAARKQIVPVWAKGGLGLNLLLFVGGLGLMLTFGISDVMAQAEAAVGPMEVSTGYGLALIGIGLPTGLATIGAGIAVSSVGAASLAVIAEKPEIFGRTLIYLGLGEGIAIYGLVVTILMLGKI